MMGPIGSQVAVIISNALVMGISTDVDSESTAWDVTEVDPRQQKIPRDFSDFFGVFLVQTGFFGVFLGNWMRTSLD